MPDPITGAVIGSTVIGAGASKSASKSAAKGQEKGLAASNAMSQQAIGQAKDYFNIGQRSAQAGFQSALDFFKNTQPAKYEPMIQGNVAAQRVIGQGAQQANNAILGLPVDMSFANQQTAIQPNYSAIQSAQIPMSYSLQTGPQQTTTQPLTREQSAEQSARASQPSANIFSGMLGGR
jgi:hypothetical protein